jgi:hypothetical protein
VHIRARDQQRNGAVSDGSQAGGAR